MILSQNQKIFSEFFAEFQEPTKNLESFEKKKKIWNHLKKKDGPHR